MPYHQTSIRAITVITLGGAFLYAIVRYNVVKGVAWGHLPLLISNKAIALAAVAFIALSFLLGPLARFVPGATVSLLPARKFFGLLGFGLGATHALISLLLFTPANYPKFFLAEGSLNAIGELSMLFGVLAFLVFALVAISDIPGIGSSMQPKHWHDVQRMGYAGLLLVLFHVVVMGFEGWMNPSGWPGGLIPISMVAAIIIAFTLLLRIVVLVSPNDSTSHAILSP